MALLALLAGASCIPRAQAQILFDNGAPNPLGGGFYADTSAFSTMAGDLLTLPSGGQVNQIIFAGDYDVPDIGITPLPDDNFTLNLYSTTQEEPNGVIAPGTLISSSQLTIVSRTVLNPKPNYGVYIFAGNLDTPLTFSPGTEYYLGLSDTTSPYEPFEFTLTATEGPANVEYTLTEEGVFLGGDSGYSFSFELLDIPEPSTWLLLLGGLGLLSLIHRRARSHP